MSRVVRTVQSPARASPLIDRRAGVLAHLSSLDAVDGVGDLGPAAHRFLRWLAASGFRAWQMLPIGPVGPGDSPYSAESSFAGEPLFVSLDALVDEGWLSRTELRCAREARSSRSRAQGRPTTTHSRDASRVSKVNWSAARRFKRPLLQAAYAQFVSRGGARSAEYRGFLRRSAWLPDWCAFVEGRGESPGEAAFVQFAFDQQWAALRTAAREHDVQLVGDLPIFVAPDSADVQAHPELFRLDARGHPTVVTGVPPDVFSRTGQRWGHPHYRWSAHERSGFAWWRSRVRAAAARFDLIRIDHFIAFVRAWEVPSAQRTAQRGRWRRTPGHALLRAVERDLGALPFIAEDLGAVTPAVIELRDTFALPGMRILQNAFGSDDANDLPHHHPRNAVVYSATHDNDTTLGWWKSLPRVVRRRFVDYAGGSPTERTGAPPSSRARSSAHDAVWSMMRLVLTSPAQMAIVPMQDLLGLGSHARMNFPGRATGQWRWRLDAQWRRTAPAARLRRLLTVAGRCSAATTGQGAS